MSADDSTDRRELIAARNRANARKSTGPRTEAGKARAARNAITHGLTAQTPVDDEEALDLERRAAALAEILEPENGFEQALVDRMAAAFQRLEKADRLEGEAFASIVTIRPQSPGGQLANNSRCRQTFNVINRYRATATGELHGTIRLLEALRQARRSLDLPVLRNEANTSEA